MLVNKIKLKHCFSLVTVVVFSAGLTACSDSAVKRDLFGTPVSESFKPDGHIEPAKTVQNSVQNSSEIPSIVGSSSANLPDFVGSSAAHYSITAVNVPVSELIFQVAKDAGKQVDLYTGIKGRVTINAINQPLEKILERISEQVGLMYVIDNNVIQIKPDLPEWRNYNVDYVNISRSTKDSIDMKMSVSGGSSSGNSTSASSTQVTVESKHDFWVKLEANIQQLAQIDPYSLANNSAMSKAAQGNESKAGGVSQNTAVNAEAGVISVYTTSKKHKAIKKYIEDVATRADRQVLIEATVVEVLLNDRYQAGIDWTILGSKAFGNDGGLQISSPFSGEHTGFTVKTVDPTGVVGALSADWSILANLNLLKEFGDSKVLSSPKIMAINNQTALLKVVQNLVYFTVDVNATAATATVAGTTTYETEIHTVPVGFTMSVTPFVSGDGEVTLNVRPTISRQIGTAEDPNPELKKQGVTSKIPIIQEKEMSSVLKLKDRQTAVIGGLIEDANSNLKTGIPWLGDIPLLGDLFSNRDDQAQKSELVIFIRPIIVKNPDVDRGDLQQLGRFMKSTSN